MSDSHTELFVGSEIKVGTMYLFAYPEEFTTLDDYSEHRNQVVTVIRATSEDEADVLWDDPNGTGDEIVDRMFVVRAEDGWVGHAWESELLVGGEVAS